MTEAQWSSFYVYVVPPSLVGIVLLFLLVKWMRGISAKLTNMASHLQRIAEVSAPKAPAKPE